MSSEKSANQPSPATFPASLREIVTDAMRYWEPRRLLYNGVLSVLVVIYFFALWPGSVGLFSVGGLITLFILAVLANVAYCAAYLPDIVLQFSHYRTRIHQLRTALLVIGILFAAALARQILVSIFAPLP